MAMLVNISTHSLKEEVLYIEILKIKAEVGDGREEEVATQAKDEVEEAEKAKEKEREVTIQKHSTNIPLVDKSNPSV